MSLRLSPLLLASLGFFVFVAGALRTQEVAYYNDVLVGDRVVIGAPVLLSLYAGDRFLAANLEVMRLSATGMSGRGVDSGYLVRAQAVVSELNSCHEDNYYLANGLLTWGGAVSEGDEILRRAMVCRFWDGVPAFFYGVNRAFFDHDTVAAMKALEVAAQRWPENAAPLRKLAIMLKVESFADENLAMNYLQQQRDKAEDAKLRDLLGKRVIRLKGLIDLRAAQRHYESVHGKLESLQQLVSSGELKALPDDPLHLGYELRDGRIEMRRLRVAGVEGQP